jgi:hypothetical protein
MAIRKVLLLVSASLVSLNGCAFKARTTGMAVEYNDFVAQTTNRQTLLNVLRAREREPMHFTSFSVVRGTVRGQANAELSATEAANTAQSILKTIGKSTTAATGAVSTEATEEDTRTINDNGLSPTLRAGLQVSTGTDFDIAINATDDFYRGILGPLKESVVVHYLRQRFPADLLSHLVIGEIRFYAVFKRKEGEEWKDIDPKGEVVQPGKEKYGHTLVASLPNTPDDPVAAELFQEAIHCRNLSYAIDRRDKRSITFGNLAELSSVAPEVLARVSSEAGAPPTYKFNIGEANDLRLAPSEQKNCKAITERLALLGADRINDFAEDLNLGGEQLNTATAPLPGRQVAPTRGLLKQQAREIDTSQNDSVQPPAQLGRSGSYEFETKDFFLPLLKARKVPAHYTGDLVIEVTLRSVEGILYYLGKTWRGRSRRSSP